MSMQSKVADRYLSRQAAAKVEVEDNSIRKAYYDMADGLVGLEDAVKGDKATKGDKALLDAMSALRKAENAVYKHLEAHYIWD
jgi:hypothetical protein